MQVKQIMNSIKSLWGKTNNKVDKTTNITTTNTDLNDYTEEGTYFFSSATYAPENRPAGTNGWLKVIKGSGDWIKQLWYRAGTNNSNDWQIFVRTKSATLDWSDWRELQTKERTLYENNSGTTGTVTLSDSTANYNCIEIFYKTNDNLYGSCKVNSANGKNIVITSSMPTNDSGNCYLKSTQYSISGTKITPQKYSEVALYTKGDLKVDASENRITIVKVVGWI